MRHIIGLAAFLSDVRQITCISTQTSHIDWANEVLKKGIVTEQTPQNKMLLLLAQQLRNLEAGSLPEVFEDEFAYNADLMKSSNLDDGSMSNELSNLNPLRSTLGSTNDKNSYAVPIPLQAIWGYGCWCHFGEDLLQGQGTPVNTLDQFCKDMQLCLRCAVMDGNNCPSDENDTDFDHDETCDPKTQNYESEFSKLPEEQSILADCADANPTNLCAKNTCCCEMKFISDLLSLITSMQPFDINFQHKRGWDYEGNCLPKNTSPKVPSNGGNPGPPNPGPGNGDDAPQDPDGKNNTGDDKACCGKYPYRFVYHTNNMDCCEDVNAIYSPLSHECCADGSGVKSTGMC